MGLRSQWGTVWLGALILLTGCAHVAETRTRTVLGTESVRLGEIPQADLDRVSVEYRLVESELVLRVVRQERCVVDLAERHLIRERIVREPRQSSLAGEAVLLGVGTAAAVTAFESSSDDEGSGVRPSDVVGVTALAIAVASGVALTVDASRHTDRTETRSIVTPRKEQRVAACEKRSAPPQQLELVTPNGRRLASGLDGHGRARVRLPDDLWPDDGRLDSRPGLGRRISSTSRREEAVTARVLLVGLLLLTGCMLRESHVQSSPATARIERGRAIRESQHRYALVIARGDALEIRARERDLCRKNLVVLEKRDLVTEHRASPDRYWGAAAALVGGSVLLSRGKGDKAQVFGVVLLAGAAAVVGVPMLLEHDDRKPSSPGERRQSMPPVPCGDRALPHVSVTVRTQGVTLEGTADVAGRVRFFDYVPDKDMLIYLDDAAVPVVFDAAPRGTSPLPVSPAHPASPTPR